MRKYITYFISALFLFLIACEEEIILDATTLQAKLVVNSYISPDAGIHVKLYQDIPLNTNVPSTEISEAQILLYEDGKEIEQLKQHFYLLEQPTYDKPGERFTDTIYYYTSEKAICQIGKKYQLKVSKVGFEDVFCETSIPSPVEVISIDTFTAIQTDDWGSSINNHFKLRFKDPKEETNYYRLIIKEKSGTIYRWEESKDTVNTVYVSENQGSSYFNSEDPVFSFESQDANSYIFGSSWNEYGIFTDELINGKEYELSFYQSQGYGGNYVFKPEEGEFREYTCELHSITAELYYYLKSIDQQRYNTDMPFTEPVPIYTNVENGLGIFAGTSYTSISIMKGEYPMDGIVYEIQQ